MEAIWNEALRLQWWIPAACDLLTLAAVTAMVAVWPRRAGRVLPRLHELHRAEEATPAPTHEPAPDPAPRASAVPAARGDVRRALEAIGRWEDSYRGGRGVAELARFVEKQKSARDVRVP